MYILPRRRYRRHARGYSSPARPSFHTHSNVKDSLHLFTVHRVYGCARVTLARVAPIEKRRFEVKTISNIYALHALSGRAVGSLAVRGREGWRGRGAWVLFRCRHVCAVTLTVIRSSPASIVSHQAGTSCEGRQAR